MEPQVYSTPEQMYGEVLKIYNDPETKYYNGFSGGTYADGTVEWFMYDKNGQRLVFRSKYIV